MRFLAKYWLAFAACLPLYVSGQSISRPENFAFTAPDLSSGLGKSTHSQHFSGTFYARKENLAFDDLNYSLLDNPSQSASQSRTGSRWFANQNDSPYKLNVPRGAPIVGLGVGLVGASFVARNNKTALTFAEIEGLNRNKIWSMDRGATTHYSASAGRMSDYVLYSSIAMPLLYLTAEKTRHDFGRIILMQFETGLVAYGLVSLTKAVTNRVRPFAYNPSAPLDKKLTMNAKESFFSGHTSTTAAMSFFMATTFSQYYPDSPWKPVLWTYAIVWPAAAGYLRYRSGSHYPTDIISGYIIGAASGIIIPKIHQKIRSHKKTHSPAY